MCDSIVKSIYVYSKVYLLSDTATVTSAERYYILVGAGKFIAVSLLTDKPRSLAI